MKRLVLTRLTVLLCVAGFAQPKLHHEEMYVGAHGGAIASMYRFAPEVTQSWKHPFLGWNAGLVYRYIGHKVCGMQVEVNYMQRGWYEPNNDYTRQLDYVEVPFLMHLYFGKKARGFFNLGPQIGYCIRDVETGTVPTVYDVARKAGANSKHAHEYAAVEKPFDWGLAASLGFYYRSKYAGVYQLEARFNWSFGNTFNDSKMDYFDYSTPMSLSLNFAYMWQVKGDK